MVVSAIRVAVTQQHLVTMDGSDVRVGQDRDAGFLGKDFADHEVAIAVHEVHRNAVVGELAQRTLDREVVRIWVIVADPRLEQVTEDVKILGFTGLRLEEMQELLADSEVVKVIVVPGRLVNFVTK